jgi:ribosome hibernation promoting factor
MNLTIRHDGFEMTEAIELHVRDRLTAALDQHISHVRAVAITVRDENGPRGGVDKSCQVQVDLDLHRGPVLVKKLHEDVYLAVTEAADAVKRAVGRLVGKSKKHR